MKKLFLAFAVASVMLSSTAVYASDEEPGNSIFQIILGPMLDVKDWGANQFGAGIAVGGKYVRFGLGYTHGTYLSLGLNAVRPSLIIDIPFTFDVGSKSQFAIGPIIDLGPSFGFISGEKIIDVMILGFGLDVKFYFNDYLGVSLTPVHLSSSFATWASGGVGFTKQFRMSYDLLFSFILRW